MIMLLHDPSDIILEVAKMLNYAEWEQTSTVMFAVFMASWFLTRLVYFPFWIVWSTRWVGNAAVLDVALPLCHMESCSCLTAGAGAFDSTCRGLFDAAAGLAVVHFTHTSRLLMTNTQAAWGFATYSSSPGDGPC